MSHDFTRIMSPARCRAIFMLVLLLLALPLAAGAATATTIDLGTLNGPSGFRIDGRNPGDRAGRALAPAGDVNGDGLDDYILGAATADPDGLQGGGEAYVVFGATSNPTTLSLTTLDGANGFRLTGATFNDAAGESVGGGGDVNGDGYDDVIIGAPGADPDELSEAGAAYVVFGGPAFPTRLELAGLDGQHGFRLTGATEEEAAGVAVAIAGDVNGDGLDDFIVGAPNATAGGKAAAGKAYIVFGAASFAAQLNLGTLDGNDGFALQGVGPEAFVGSNAGAAGDMNGDGYDDVYLTAWHGHNGPADERGAVYVLFGRPTFPAKVDVDDLTGAAGFRAEGHAAGDRAGQSARAAGDVNGDGRDDLVIGAPFAGGHDGAAYVVLGAASLPALDLGGLNGANGFRLLGESNSDTGMAVGAADVNGDGLNDVIVGASAAGMGLKRFAGRSYVIFGRPTFDAAIELGTLDDAAGLRLDGAVGGDQSGQSLAGAGDVDGDGYDEILISAPNAGIGETGDRGQTYLVQGGPTLGAPLPVTKAGTTGNDNLVGTTGVDVMLGDRGADIINTVSGDDALKGGAGDDILIGGPGGDRLVGGNGRDSASYADSSAAVTVNLFTRSASGGDAAGDRLYTVEGVIGSAFLDTLSGDARPNRLDGGAGDDHLTGGAGNDAFVFRPQSRNDTVTDFTPGVGSDDYLDLTLYPDVEDIDDVTIRAEDSDTLITLPGEATIRLLEVVPGALHADDFRFAGAPLARPDTFSTPVNTMLNVAAPGVLANDENPSTVTLLANLVEGPAHGTLTLNANGGFSYSPEADFLGTDSFRYRANNSQPSNVARVTLRVTAVPPTAVDDTYTVALGDTLNVVAPGVLANDQNPGGAPLTAQLVDEPVDGTLTFNDDGSFSYTATGEFGGQDSFNYVASNGLTSQLATVTINVFDPNGPPIAVDDAYTLQTGKTLSVAAPGVLGNDSNPQANAMTASLAGGPAHGTLALNANGSFTYTPQSGYTGADQFTYRANNGQASNVATVRLTVSSSGYRIALPAVMGD